MRLWVQFAASVLILHVLIVIIVFNGSLDPVGPDSYMRLLRVELLWNTGEWFNNVIDRANAPFGHELHWTRVFDLIILFGSLPFIIFVEPSQAIAWSGIMISPLLHIGTGFLIYKTTTPILKRETGLLAMFLTMTAIPIITSYLPGRSDHHSLQLLLLVATICSLIHLMDNEKKRLHWAACMGVTLGLGLWVSSEALFSLLFVSGYFGLLWIIKGNVFSKANFIFHLMLTGTITLAVITEHPFSAWSQIEYDRISIVHLYLSLCMLTVFGIINILEKYQLSHKIICRIIGGIIAIIAVFVAMILVYPLFFNGPMAMVNPRIHDTWHNHIVEMQSLVPRDRASLSTMIYAVGAPILSFSFLTLYIFKNKQNRFLWMFLYCLLFLYLILSIKHLRFSSTLALLSVIPMAMLIHEISGLTKTFLRALYRIFITIAVVFGPLLISQCIKPASNNASAMPHCSVKQLAKFLNQPIYQNKPHIIAGNLSFGPELLYRTHHHVIATPYHRNDEGTLAVYDIFTKSNKDSLYWIKKHHVDLIFLCPNQGEYEVFQQPFINNASPSLYQNLIDEKPPSWLTPIVLPIDLSNFLLYAVSQDKIPSSH